MKFQPLLVLLSLCIALPLFAQDKAKDAATVEKLKAIEIPELTFKGASIYDVTDFLVAASRKNDPEKKGINIILDLKAGDGNAPVPRVTINLRKVKLGQAIKLVADVTNLKAGIHKGTVTLTSKGAAPADGPKDAPDEATLKQMEGIIIPQLVFKNASIHDVADFLAAVSAEQDPAKKGINVVVDAKDLKDIPKVTISLRRVSMADAVTFVADVTNMDSTVHKGTVVISEKERGDPVDTRMATRLEMLKADLNLTPAQKRLFEKAADDLKAMAK